MSSAADPAIDVALRGLAAAAEQVAALDLAPTEVDQAYAAVRALEDAGRRVAAQQQRLAAHLDRVGLHKQDGHASAAVLVRHAANLSDAEGARRAKAGRILRDLPQVAAAFAAGRIGLPQVDRIARLHANRRVRAQLIEVDRHVAELAARLPYRDLDRKLAQWERLTDEDGAGDKAERNHQRRDYVLRPNLDGSFRHEGGCGGLQGAEMRTIHEHYVAAEFAADWAEARALHGDGAALHHLARTDAQRRADALHAIFRDAATARAQQPGGSRIITNLVLDQATFERHLRRFCGDDPGPDPRRATLLTDDPSPGAMPARCETLDGLALDPAEVAAQALVGHVRRGVVGADGVTIDLGRTTRLFTGPAQLAVRLQRTTCYWPGCHVPVSHCQSDHLEAFNGPRRGSTSPGNGGPLCGKHNRFKQHGFTVHRDGEGTYHVLRPDGTEIPRLPDAA